ncbi:sulfatase-like hydrolase/transferase [Dyadobacter aurulentus]|uniref:sulfatase-like hydrolase/transferase n=1 Tax=Dyadobacter sp. UC 10 TaxID=2605428 RepID=UPI0011F3A708|nr:sulfatase-like hydrolase/transferase [Dyadobacter sp. UC 10]KAA0992632.1 sulfatase-like hydrolase/transferase [Dyadobacter sp. UC 10]
MKRFKISTLTSFYILLLAALAGFPVAAQQKKAAKPNIIFILVDDMGWGDVGAFWQNQRTKKNDRSEPWQFTPSLDAMAKSGAMLTNHYCAAPVCAPSRASILLGVSQGHSNVRDNQFDKELQNTFTIGNVLQKAGYKTGLVGKWGLQGLKATEPEWPAHPLNRGFDYSYAYIKHVDGHEHYPKEGIYRGKKKVWENKTEVSDGLDKCFTTDLWTAAAKNWIVKETKTGKKEEPFFLYLAYDVPHAVLELPTQQYPAGGGLRGGLQWLGTPGKMINTASGEPDSYVHPDYANATYDDDKNPSTPEKPWPDTYKRYATLCRRIDDGIGDIFKLLTDLKIDQNTMVVFTSDNGPSVESYLPKEYADYSPEFFNSFGPFDGIKRDVWEGGVRVPTIVSWPGQIPANQVIDAPSASHDWLSTFADAAQVPSPARADGVTLLPRLTGKGNKTESLVYIEYDQNGKTPDFEEFSPNHRSRKRNQMQKIRKGDFVGVRYGINSAEDDFEIYNVVKDPQETKNLAADPAFRQMQQDFKAQVLQVRRPDAEAQRPYDNALIPPVATRATKSGLRFKVYKGIFPWVADLKDEKPAEGGVLSSLDFSKIKTKTGLIVLEGMVRIDKDGTYQMTMSGNSGFLMKLHQANVLDGSFEGQTDQQAAASVALKAGDHPVRIFYHIKEGKAPLLTMNWQAPGGDAGHVPAGAFVHN